MTSQRLPPPVAELPFPNHDVLRVSARRNLRLLFWLFTLSLFSGTHYPKAQFGIAGDSPDKLIHFLAFGMWGMLLWGSGYVRRPVRVMLATLAFSVFDECTQMIPALGRIFDPYDLIADSMGALLVMAWVFALSPGTDDRPQLRAFHTQEAVLFNQIFGSWSNILLILISTSLGAMLGSVGFILIFSPFDFLGVYTLAILGLEIGGLFGLVGSYYFAHRTLALRMDPDRPGGNLLGFMLPFGVFMGALMVGILIVYPFMSRFELGDLGIAGIFSLLLAGLAWWVGSCRTNCVRVEDQGDQR